MDDASFLEKAEEREKNLGEKRLRRMMMAK